MWIAQTEAARQVNVTKQRINALVREGKLTPNERKQVNLQQVLAFFSKGRDPAWAESPLVRSAAVAAAPAAAEAPAAEPDAGAGGEYRDAKLLQARIKAERDQFELERARGLYVSRREVEDAMVTAGRRISQKLDAGVGWADELYAKALSSSAQELRQLLKVKFRALRQEIADELAADGTEENETPAHADGAQHH